MHYMRFDKPEFVSLKMELKLLTNLDLVKRNIQMQTQRMHLFLKDDWMSALTSVSANRGRESRHLPRLTITSVSEAV